MGEGRAANMFYDDFSHAFNAASHNITVSKLGCLKNWSGSKVVVSELYSKLEAGNMGGVTGLCT